MVLYLALLLLDPSLLFNTPRYVDVDSLALIISFLLISRGLELSGVFNRVANWMVEKGRGSPRKFVLFALVFTAFSATLLMNDASLFIYLPIVKMASTMLGIDFAAPVVLITLAANIGSALTPIGNPQNIIIWRHFHLGFLDFVEAMAPFALPSLLILLAYSQLVIKSSNQRAILRPAPRVKIDGKLALASILLLPVAVLLAEIQQPLLAVVSTVLVFATVSRHIIRNMDYPLIAIFALMFIDFQELSKLSEAAHFIPPLQTAFHVLVASIALSQVFSNVPATLTLLRHVSSWKPLAVGVNLGGVGLIVGSMANIIAVRLTNLRLRDYHVIVLPYFAALVLFYITLSLNGLYP